MCFAGIYSDHSNWIQPFADDEIMKIPILHARQTSASLCNVQNVELFQSKNNKGGCAGAIISYHDGTQNVLGECRVGQSKSTCYDNPVYLCFKTAKRYTVAVCTTKGNMHHHKHRKWKRHEWPRPQWKCCEMRGTLTWWLTYLGEQISYKV